MSDPKEPAKPVPETYGRFEKLAQQLFAVPRAELEKKMDRYNAKKSRKKKKRQSGDSSLDKK
jgi:hypothetical protein